MRIAWVLGYRRTRRAVSADDVQDARRQHLVGQLGQAQGAQRRQLGGLQARSCLPAARAGPIFQMAIITGSSHGVICPTTPSASRRTIEV